MTAKRIGRGLVAASAEPLLLAVLQRGSSYGYAIIQRVRELSDGDCRRHRAFDELDGLCDPGAR